MTTQETAQKLVALCREQKFNQAYKELFADNALAREPGGEDVQGLQNLMEKSKSWEQAVDTLHSLQVSEPLVYGNHFSVGMSMDITFKGQERRVDDEICVYETNADGKIVKEQFFYPMG